MSIFLQSKFDRIKQICDTCRAARIQLIAQIYSSDDEKGLMIAKGVELSQYLDSYSQTHHGELRLNISTKACPSLRIEGNFILGNVSVSQQPHAFKIPLEAVTGIVYSGTNDGAEFEIVPEIYTPVNAEKEPEPEPVKTKPQLRLV